MAYVEGPDYLAGIRGRLAFRTQMSEPLRGKL